MHIEQNKFDLLREITALNLVSFDLHLYLNTHPMDREALAKYNTLIMQTSALKQNYEKMYGMLSAHSTGSPYPWQWICEPWPWEYEANYKLCKEEK